MAETFIFSIVGTVAWKLSSILLEDIGLAWGAKDDLKRLENTLSTIKAVLLDAEKQQAKNHEVRDWLGKLKDVLYDIDDLLDDFSAEVLRKKVEESMLKQVSKLPLLFRFTLEIPHKIKNIRERLDEIAEDRRKFHLTEQVVDAGVEQSRIRESHSFVHESGVIGRDSEKEEIVKLVMSSADHGELPVIPIVGLGGLGKTTLTKLVYNDQRVIPNFELRIWVCVSEDFDLRKLIEKVLTSATNHSYGHLYMDQLQDCFRHHICAKRFLLILDDVWNEDVKKWLELRDLFKGSAKGSKIVVTTRNTRVALIMGTVPPYNLKVLSNDACLSMFIKYAFKGGQEKENPKLLEIGKAIVNKCGGIPLAVITLGSLLHMRTDEEEWNRVKNNEIWRIEQKENDILPILRLSYDQMPPDLKQCFAYCSIYPKDYDITKKDLVALWQAQGFIRPLAPGNQQLEGVGNQYFNELLSRSFVQDVVRIFDVSIWKCKMHDLVHDLAQSTAGTEFLAVNLDTNAIISEKVRHVSFYGANLSDKEFPRSLLKAKKLRSFRLAYKVGPISKPFLNVLVGKFKCLRVLGLSGSDFEEMPNSIGNLKHLRYINLAYNRKIKALPDSICKLLNLEMLNLLGCEQLQRLPRDIGKLISLENLYLTSQLKTLPEKGLQGLTSLRTLQLFRCRSLESLSEGLQHLTALQTLRIIECPMLTFLPSGIKCLKALKNLVIQDCQKLDLLGESQDIRGPESLQSVVIGGLTKLDGLPRSLEQAAATLQYLCIEDCPNVATLPEWFQNLTRLQGLSIVDCPNLTSLPQGLDQLIALRVLKIGRCPHLSRRCRKATGEDWPKISHVQEIYLDSLKL